MKLFVVLCLVAVAFGAPAQKINYSTNDVQLIRFENDNPGGGNYRFYFEQTDGTRQEQQGQITNEGREDESIAVKGSYSWVGPDGETYNVNYVADENGFQPEIGVYGQPGQPGYPGQPGEPGPPGIPGLPDAVVASLLG